MIPPSMPSSGKSPYRCMGGSPYRAGGKTAYRALGKTAYRRGEELLTSSLVKHVTVYSAYAADGVPAHAHQLGDGPGVAVDAQPRDLLLEGLGEPGGRPAGPGHGLDARTMVGASHSAWRVLQIAGRRA